MKDDKKPVEECPPDLAPIEEEQAFTLDSGGGDNGSNPPKPGGK